MATDQGFVRRFLAAAAVAMVLTACAGETATPGASADPQPSVGAIASATASLAGESAQPVSGAPTRPQRWEVWGGSCEENRVCLGPLEAGTHQVDYFMPAFSFEVADDGWVNQRASGGLVYIDDMTALGDGIGLFQRAAPRTFDGKLVPGMGSAADAFVSWLTQRTDLDVGQPRETEQGGLSGWVADLVVRDDAPSGVGDCPADPCVAIASGIDPAELPSWEWELDLWAGATFRIYVLDAGDQTDLILMVAWDGTQPDPSMGRLQPVVDSITFAEVATPG
jgi:hypothetical protein